MEKTRKKLWIAFAGIFAVIACFLLFNPNTVKNTYAAADANITNQTGLGLGINVVTAESFNDFKLSYMVFDDEALQALPKSSVDLNNSQSYMYSTIDERSLIAQFSFDLGNSVSAGALLMKLKAGLEAGITGDIASYCYKYYNMLEHNVERYRLSINNYSYKNTYADCYSDAFLNDLNKVKGNTMSYEAFFGRYGTHIVGSAVYGGKLNAYYTVLSKDKLINQDVKTALDGVISFQNIKNATKASAASAMSSALAISVAASDITTGFSVRTEGGNVFPSGLQSAFEAGYKSWCDSFSGNANCVVVDYATDGLVSLWEILPDEYASLAVSMKNAFVDYYEAGENEFCKIFGQGRNMNFKSGTGTESDPFVITNVTQLRAIENTSMKAHYKLGNDVDLSSIDQWTPIGGFYKERAFTGTLDGAGYKIKSLKRTSDITAKSNRSYFGLFGYVGNGGTVKNIVFSNVNIDMTGPEVTEDQIRTFLGVVAGALYGEVSGVTIESGTVRNDRQTTGMAFVGGIAGAAINATISNCFNKVNLTAGRFSGVAGGIAGYTEGSVFNNCTNSGNLLAKGTAWGGNSIVGGIAGYMYEKNKTTFTNCRNTGALGHESYNGNIFFNRKEDETAVLWDQRVS